MSKGGNSFAVFYHPDGYDVKDHPLMGRRAAGKSFLDAWIDRQGGDALYCYAASKQQFGDFCEIASGRGASGAPVWISQQNPEQLEQVGALYFPGPDIAGHAWRRFRRSPNGWSLVGITHTICSKAALDGISDWLTAPVEPWDAVICTSKAVRDSVDYQLAAQREHLARRLGATKFSGPQLPIIPLGIHTDDFAPEPQRRSQARSQLGIGDGEIAVLFVGRLDRYSKAHPSPMLIALERAAAASGVKICLVMAGWFANSVAEPALMQDAATWAPNIRLQILDGRDDPLRMSAWRAADVFISLVDNIQETFGLTPVEAMAAGLPSVVSDWDGYKDTVRDGIDGFRIPTIIPPSNLGEAIIDRFAANLDSYGAYLARSASMVVVDVEAAAAALAKLFMDRELRQRMGAAARARAVECFDWRVVLDAYQRLLDDLAERRGAASVAEFPRQRHWPSRLPPFEMFGNYATRRLRGQDIVKSVPGVDPEMIAYIAQAEKAIIRDQAAFVANGRKLLQSVQAPVTISDLLQHEAEDVRRLSLRTLLVLAKFGVISIESGEGT